MKIVSYAFRLQEDTQVRHIHNRSKNEIISFTVQLEIKLKNKWYPIVRYDTAHNFAHRDIIHKDGQIEKTPLFTTHYNEALTFADGDLRSNWRMYRENFLKEVQNETK